MIVSVGAGVDLAEWATLLPLEHIAHAHDRVDAGTHSGVLLTILD